MCEYLLRQLSIGGMFPAERSFAKEDGMRRTMLLTAIIAVAVAVSSGVAYSAERSPEAASTNLKVNKVASDTNVAVGEDFTWTVRVKNRGQSRAANVRLVDTLPMSVRLLNVTSSQGGPCRVDFPRVVCKLGNIGKGKQAVVRLKVEATQAGILRNRARATTSTNDVRIKNNRDASVVRAG